MIRALKQFIQKNSWIFTLFRYVPYRFRLGPDYLKHKMLVNNYYQMSDKEKECFHFNKLKTILDWAYKHNEFYKFFYSLNNFHPSDFKKLDDFVKVPIVTKNDLKQFALEKRSQTSNYPFKVNTGGTSGEPLEFYLDNNAFSREWAYMHTIWSKFGYSYLDRKMTFRGKDNNGIPLKYNVIHNEYIVDAYVSYAYIVKSIYLLVKRKNIKYLHGYPSSIYAFCKYLKEQGIDSSVLFNDQLKGVLFGSEYPAPMYRELIEDVLGVPTISWYGHSEMAILAYEKKEHFTYYPFQTYGFTETIKNGEEESRLIGTSYYNFNSPFIRYDTGDLVTSEEYDKGILKSFKVASGRI
ncbi:MAG: phenylacetate-CoA ligase, partial [Mariniflexile sp.]